MKTWSVEQTSAWATTSDYADLAAYSTDNEVTGDELVVFSARNSEVRPDKAAGERYCRLYGGVGIVVRFAAVYA